MKIFKTLVIFLLIIQSLFAETILIGKYDRIDLDELNLMDIRAKIDTGAKTSSLHCSFIKEIDKDIVSFIVLDDSHTKYKKRVYKLPIIRKTTVKSSNGHVSKRYVISTKVRIFGKTYDTEFTLSNRKNMNYPILLGREFLRQGFIVDVNKEDLSFSKKYNALH